MKRIVSGIMLTLLMLTVLTFNIQPVKSDYAWTETIYIRADGSVDPDTAPISSVDNVTYTLTDHIVGNIPFLSSAVVVQRDNIVFNGAGYIVQGTWASYSKGISLSGRSNVTIKNMHVKKFYYGIYLYGSTNCRIENVTATNNGYGIALSWGSNQNILSHNNATNNSYGIYIEHSNNNSITSNTITDGSLSGICLWDAPNNILFGNIVSSSRYGIELWAYGSYGNILSGNIVSSSRVDGIVLNGAHNNTLSGNIVSSNGQYGITIMADNNIIHGNTIINNSGSYWSSGIYLQFHYNNIISSNIIKDNSRGIFLYGSGENNKLFHNNFINNTNQIYVYGEHSNVWDDGYPSGGNYWSDYGGVDANGDGIGDAPYVIDADNQDRYPLMHPWSHLPVHNINTGLGYATIQEAINANETLDGHTIFVETGTYYEHVVVNKSLALIGEDRETTIIDGNGTGTIVLVEADNVTVKGFTVLRGSHGICLHDCSYNLIDGNTITSNSYGILLSDAQSNNITGSEVTYNDFGIILYCSDENVVTKNMVTNNNYGIRLEYSCNNTLSYNNMTGNLFNFGVHGESLPHFVNSIDASNTVNTKLVYYLIQQRHLVIDSSTFSNIGYLALINSTDIQVEELILTKNFQGILLAYTNNSVIKKLDVSDNYYGVSLVYSNDNVITENTIANNLYIGISVGWNSGNNSIFHNNFVNNTIQAYGTRHANAWDDGYPSGGNYWSDYTGVDVESGPYQDQPGSDGIGDAPYIIDADNVDHYPLMIHYGAPPPPTYALTITTTIGGKTDPASGTYSYTENSSVQVTAIPEAGYLFDYWELDDVNVGSANPYTVLMETNHTLKAVFSHAPPTIPVGGYSFSIQVHVKTESVLTYIALIATLTAIFTKLRPKAKRKH